MSEQLDPTDMETEELIAAMRETLPMDEDAGDPGDEVPEQTEDERTEALRRLADEHALCDVFPVASAKILVALEYSTVDRSPSELCRILDISRDTWYRHVDTLTDRGLIEQSRQQGPTTLYETTDRVTRMIESLV